MVCQPIARHKQTHTYTLSTHYSQLKNANQLFDQYKNRYNTKIVFDTNQKQYLNKKHNNIFRR